MRASDPGIATPDRRIGLVFFASVALLYLAFSPVSATGMGCVGEEMQVCRTLFGQASPWPRNGVVGLAVQCPFVALGHAIEAQSPAWEDHAVALAPQSVSPGRPWDVLGGPRAPEWNPFDLRPYASPQAMLFRGSQDAPADRAIRIFCAASVILGLVLIGRAARSAARADAVS